MKAFIFCILFAFAVSAAVVFGDEPNPQPSEPCPQPSTTTNN